MIESPRDAARRFAAAAIRDGFKPEALHEYRHEDGSPWYWRIRARNLDTGAKWIRPMHANGNGFKLGEPGFDGGMKPLYRLDEIAKRADDAVVIVEGEKAADALAGIGVLTSTSGSADTADTADWAPLRGRNVVIWPDNDDAGRRYADAVVGNLKSLGCTLRVLDVSALGLPPKGDAADWIAGHASASVDDVLALPMLATMASTSWPEPQPLPGGLPDVQAFDFDLLPDSLRPWVQDISNRMQVAPDFVAVGVLVGLGSIIGRKLGIRPQRRTDWTVVPNSWGLGIGRPGVLKSPAIDAAMAPLKRLAATAVEQHQQAMLHWQVLGKTAKLKGEENEKAARKKLAQSAVADVADLLKDETPEAPALRRYTVNDTSVASLGEVLRQNPNGLLVFRDEMVSLLKNLDREDQAEARGFYLTAWNGDSSYTVDRIGRGLNLHIPALCISMLGTTQPGKIAEYVRHAVRGGSSDDGLIQRFGLMVWPDTPSAWRNVDQYPDADAKKAAFAVYERLDKLTPEVVGAEQDTAPDGSPDGIPYLRLDNAAAEVFLEWRTGLEDRLRGGDLHPAMESHLAKYRKLVPALALTVHLADGGVGAVTEAAMVRALAWAEYLESHAKRVYASVTNAEGAAAKSIIDRVRRGDLGHEFAGWQVWRPGWAGLSDREIVKDALALLADLDWLRIEQRTTTGRASTVYVVNPRALS